MVNVWYDSYINPYKSSFSWWITLIFSILCCVNPSRFTMRKKHTASRALRPESERCSARSRPAGRWPSAAFGTVGGIKTGLFVRNQLLLAYHLPDSTSKSQLFWVEVPASRRFLVKVSIQFPTHQVKFQCFTEAIATPNTLHRSSWRARERERIVRATIRNGTVAGPSENSTTWRTTVVSKHLAHICK